MAAPASISKTIIDVDKESMVVADRETTGVPGEHTVVATSDNKVSTGVTDTEDDNMAAIDAAIMEVVATLNQELRETNVEPEETYFPEADKDEEVSHPNTTIKTTRRVYNLC